MANLYFLPCDCGQKIRVGPAQAGQAVACGCGKQLSVPTLRSLRELEAAPVEKASAEAKRPAWSPWHGAAFSGGLAVAAVSFFLCALNLWYFTGAKAFSEDHTEEFATEVSGLLDEYSAEQLLEEWNHARAEGLGHVEPPIWVRAKESAIVYRWRLTAFGGVGLMALVVAIGAVFLGRGR
jgi:hypothetical protein